MIGSSWNPSSWVSGSWADASWSDAASQPAASGGAGRRRSRQPGGAAFVMHTPRPSLDERIVKPTPVIIGVAVTQSRHQSAARVEQTRAVTAMAVQRPHTSEIVLDAAPFAEDEELFLLLAAA